MKYFISFTLMTFFGLGAFATERPVDALAAMKAAGVREYACQITIPVQKDITYQKIEMHPVIASSEKEALAQCYTEIGVRAWRIGNEVKLVATKLAWAQDKPIQLGTVWIFKSPQTPF